VVLGNPWAVASDAGINMQKLLIFNLETNSESPVLAVGIDWIVELSKHFDSTEVGSTHVGKRNELGKIRVEEIGGGNLLKRFRAILRLGRLSVPLIFHRGEYFVFHHMSPRTAVFPGIIFRMIGIPQGLWYSHASKPISLRIAKKTVNYIFTSTQKSFPIHSNKISIVGHGIPIKKFKGIRGTVRRTGAILYLGRISPVKQLNFLIEELSRVRSQLPVVFVGSEDQSAYARELNMMAKKAQINLTINKSINYSEVPQMMSSFKYFYSGTRGSVDKVALEAAIAGCLILSVEQITLDLTGMSSGWAFIKQKTPQNIADQIRFLESLEDGELRKLQKIVTEECIEKNNLNSTVTKIVQVLKSKK